jgi:23S rRNA U2552 (ribose-2'-O)-methylase RlmE/FtsJ
MSFSNTNTENFYNEFKELYINDMCAKIEYAEKLLGVPLTDDEKYRAIRDHVMYNMNALENSFYCNVSQGDYSHYFNRIINQHFAQISIDEVASAIAEDVELTIYIDN